jgi:hypothetical protein
MGKSEPQKKNTKKGGGGRRREEEVGGAGGGGEICVTRSENGDGVWRKRTRRSSFWWKVSKREHVSVTSIRSKRDLGTSLLLLLGKRPNRSSRDVLTFMHSSLLAVAVTPQRVWE